jgi:hypothetical protein
MRAWTCQTLWTSTACYRDSFFLFTKDSSACKFIPAVPDVTMELGGHETAFMKNFRCSYAECMASNFARDINDLHDAFAVKIVSPITWSTALNRGNSNSRTLGHLYSKRTVFCSVELRRKWPIFAFSFFHFSRSKKKNK